MWKSQYNVIQVFTSCLISYRRDFCSSIRFQKLNKNSYLLTELLGAQNGATLHIQFVNEYAMKFFIIFRNYQKILLPLTDDPPQAFPQASSEVHGEVFPASRHGADYYLINNRNSKVYCAPTIRNSTLTQGGSAESFALKQQWQINNLRA